ncbi:hypothetical protein HHI36_016490 [Cryptolaemus montrouzieri]|uniref:Uncharacterized protein n=1 Tax=Cryptolaemus montrouzieri TaxID=559131 RepID=A0ABD2NKN9_9CUCU
MWMALVFVCGFFTLVTSLAFCLCWKKKQSECELTGVGGLVTKKNPDENVNHLPSADITVIDGVSNGQDVNKRATLPTNTRRSLPDIPLEHENVNWEPTIDNSSEHYATVEQYQSSTKRHTLANGVEARHSLSQQSSLSQADFSPYERVKYDKINSREHPYEQLQPTTSQCSRLENEEIPEESSVTQRPDPSPDEMRATRGSIGANSVDILAASAVAGSVAASPDLPYMTPPVAQTHFSGDSQDSSRYTSISVREPLSNIKSQTVETAKKRELDPHYSTVSDDSDDVYTTIRDPNQIYAHGSETYARIPPGPIVVEAEINQSVSRSSHSDDTNREVSERSRQPVPPSVDSLKYVTHTRPQTHSRQGSSSSSTNIGSPKPEKRQANSPLPPPPPTLSSEENSSLPRNIDDLYAKVQKNKSKTVSEEEPQLDKVIPEASTSSIEEGKRMELKKFQGHNYETLRRPNSFTEPDYTTIKHEEPGYESITDTDSGYEIVKDNLKQEQRREEMNDFYSVVNKKGRNDKAQEDCLNEPNYETVPSGSILEFPYSGLKSSGSESDPNYESVSHDDPKYERVKCPEEPPYEKVNSVPVDYEEVDSNRGDADTFKQKNKSSSSDSDSDSVMYTKIEDSSTHKSNSSSSESSLKRSDLIKSGIVSDNTVDIHDENVIFEV